MESGDLVTANVRLERLLSEGGMGSVWVADHLTLSTKVAVKFMSAEMAGQPEALSRFKREASAAARVKSPHIVQVFDYGLTRENIPYIVMELLHGEDLESRVDRAPLSIRETHDVIQQVCKALGRAHQQGIIHRDIKPPNIFLVDVDGDIFVKVLDFDIAKQTIVDEARVTHVTRSGAMLGTPHYMSPEQIMTRPPSTCDPTSGRLESLPIGQILTGDGGSTDFAVPNGGKPTEITVGPDGALWFTETDQNYIGRFLPP